MPEPPTRWHDDWQCPCCEGRTTQSCSNEPRPHSQTLHEACRQPSNKDGRRTEPTLELASTVHRTPGALEVVRCLAVVAPKGVRGDGTVRPLVLDALVTLRRKAQPRTRRRKRSEDLRGPQSAQMGSSKSRHLRCREQAVPEVVGARLQDLPKARKTKEGLLRQQAPG